MSGQMNVYGCSCLKDSTHRLYLVKKKEKRKKKKKSMPNVNHSVASLVTLLLDLAVSN